MDAYTIDIALMRVGDLEAMSMCNNAPKYLANLNKPC